MSVHGEKHISHFLFEYMCAAHIWYGKCTHTRMPTHIFIFDCGISSSLTISTSQPQTHIAGAHQTAHKYTEKIHGCSLFLLYHFSLFKSGMPFYAFLVYVSALFAFARSLTRSPHSTAASCSCCRFYESFRFTLYALARLFSSTCLHVLIYDAVLFILSFNHMGFTASCHSLAMRTPAKQ